MAKKVSKPAVRKKTVAKPKAKRKAPAKKKAPTKKVAPVKKTTTKPAVVKKKAPAVKRVAKKVIPRKKVAPKKKATPRPIEELTTTRVKPLRSKKSEKKFVKISENASSDKFTKMGERLQKHEVRWAYYAIDGKIGYHYYLLM